MSPRDANGISALTYFLRARGFEPSLVHNTYFVEYMKTYADAQGRIARAVVQFERPSAGIQAEVRAVRAAAGDDGSGGSGAVLSGFTVLVQAHVEASEEAVLTRAPPVMQEDLLACLRCSEERPVDLVTFETCARCTQGVSEYFVLDGCVVCRPCKESATESVTHA